jgi:hypothetical protein
VLVLLASIAHAEVGYERPSPGGGEPCTDWCGHEHAWETVESGTGPETGPATLLELGVASATMGERTETASLFGFEFRFPLALRDTSSAAQRAMRLRVDVQRLAWRVGAMERASSDTGGSVALGYTETLLWFSRRSKIAATIDVEGARGLDVRGGLGLRTLETSSRAVGAAGLAVGIDSRIGGLRGHARVLKTLTSDAGWSRAVEIGAGVATRFDWPRFHGPWPIELWADLCDRRAFDGGAHERELATGLNYVAKSGFSRIGIVAITNDGSTGITRTLMVHFDRPFGSQ